MGGNVFQGTKPFDHSKIEGMMKKINSVLKQTKAQAIPIGSGATPKPGKISGDLDMIVDQGFLGSYFNQKKPIDIKKGLQALFDRAGFDTAISGQSVHVKVPAEGEFHQVDIMIVPDAATAAKFHTHSIPDGSQYKGKHKHIAMSWLAKQQNMKWSPYKGLINRDTNELVSNDLDEIAKILIGPNAKAIDLGSVENIANALPDGGEEMMAALSQDKGFAPQESQELNRLVQLSGI